MSRGRPACPVRKAARDAAIECGSSTFAAPPCKVCGGTVYHVLKNRCRDCHNVKAGERRKTSQGKIQAAKDARAYRASNPAYTLVRDTMKRLVAGCKTGLRASQVFDLVGYTSDDLKAHMQTLFVDGMSWENHGDWHIDHIKPVAAFKAEGVTDLRIINALSNLQPLWAAENMSKGARH